AGYRDPLRSAAHALRAGPGLALSPHDLAHAVLGSGAARPRAAHSAASDRPCRRVALRLVSARPQRELRARDRRAVVGPLVGDPAVDPAPHCLGALLHRHPLLAARAALVSGGAAALLRRGTAGACAGPGW